MPTNTALLAFAILYIGLLLYQYDILHRLFSKAMSHARCSSRSLVLPVNTAPSYSVYPDITSTSLHNHLGAHRCSVAFGVSVAEGQTTQPGGAGAATKLDWVSRDNSLPHPTWPQCDLSPAPGWDSPATTKTKCGSWGS